MSDESRSRLGWIVSDNARVLLYAILIALAVVYAPLRAIRFIYAEF
jgi:hypothetical protein